MAWILSSEIPFKSYPNYSIQPEILIQTIKFMQSLHLCTDGTSNFHETRMTGFMWLIVIFSLRVKALNSVKPQLQFWSYQMQAWKHYWKYISGAMKPADSIDMARRGFIEIHICQITSVLLNTEKLEVIFCHRWFGSQPINKWCSDKHLYIAIYSLQTLTIRNILIITQRHGL